MNLKTIKDKLCCPFDKKNLDLTIITKGLENNILEGILTCQECQRIYPIVKGIPIMTPDEFREIELEKPLFKKWENYLGNKKVEYFRIIGKQ